MEKENNDKPSCPECGSDNIEILDNEGVAICQNCWLEWPYINEE